MKWLRKIEHMGRKMGKSEENCFFIKTNEENVDLCSMIQIE